MKKSTKNALISVIGASMIASAVPFSACAGEEIVPVYNIDVRIEGISECLYCGSLTISGDDGLTVAEVLEYADAMDASLTITGLSEGYITAVNDDTAGAFGGWDGWLYDVNGVEATAGAGDYTLSSGDSILLYYSDKYGVGMQFPVMSCNDEEGVITFTSLDTVYDENWNPSTVENPISGMTVVLEAENEAFTFETDENGQADIGGLAAGSYSVSWSRYTESGLPTVLRNAPETYIDLGFSLGDVNEDNTVNAIDATAILTAYAAEALENESGLTELQRLAADTDNDGAVNAVDATNVLCYYAYASLDGTGSFRDFLRG